MIEKNQGDYKEKIISKIDEVYNEYLNQKLDMIFRGNTGKCCPKGSRFFVTL